MTTTPIASGSKLVISTHPLVLSKLTQLRLHDLPSKDFREGIKAIAWVNPPFSSPLPDMLLTRMTTSSMLLFEASRSLPLASVPEVNLILSHRETWD